MAYMTMAHSLGMLSGALLGGMMMDLFKLEFAFPASALVMSVSIGLFLVGTYHRNTLKLP
jgi:predicted MFS family arabinose efflux permease